MRVYLNPGPESAKRPWPKVTVGQVKGPEDAVLADLDGDGAVDVVSATEGTDVAGGNGVFVHWAPAQPSSYLDSAEWKTVKIPLSEGGNWIQAAVSQVDGHHGLDLIVGGHEDATGQASRVVVLLAPRDARAIDLWQLHEIHRIGRKIMSLDLHDFDGDGDLISW